MGTERNDLHEKDVIAGLGPAIQGASHGAGGPWMRGSSPRMTIEWERMPVPEHEPCL
jgi:hypothetical protein